MINGMILNDKLQLKQGGKRPRPNLSYSPSLKPVNSRTQSRRVNHPNVTFVTNSWRRNLHENL